MRFMTVLSVALVAMVAGCASQSVDPVSSSGSPLTLTSKTKERVSGEYSQNGVTVKFDAIRVGANMGFEMKAVDGLSLVKGELVGDDFVTKVLGGRLVITYTTKVDDGVTFTGDEGAMAALEQRAEYKLLPLLSAEMGRLGINGRDYPAALAMHMFNKSVAERLNMAMPADVGDEVAPAEGDAEYCTAYPNQGNDCYGMCGRGCSCWSFVCGDCCYHSGCATHDNYCRGSGFWDTAKCWTAWGAAFFGC